MKKTFSAGGDGQTSSALVCNGKNLKRKRAFNVNRAILFFLASLGAIFLMVFSYSAMFGLALAFTDGDFEIKIVDALNAEFVGFQNFKRFFNDVDFIKVLTNTIGLNLLMLLINFPAPIIFALCLNEIKHPAYKKTIQTLTSFPHFISWMIYGSIVLFLINADEGVVNKILAIFGAGDVNLTRAEYFWAVMIISSLLKGVGWGSIIYLSAITTVDTSLYEAAVIDGANRFQKAIYVTLPSILPTITIYFLLTVSRLLGNNFEQFYSMQNGVNLDRSEVLATFIYKKGLSLRRYSYATAVGLFESVVSICLLTVSNFISKKLTGKGLF